jgi:hypothetical protein
MSPFGKQINFPYRSLLAALMVLAVTLMVGSTAMAQAPQNRSRLAEYTRREEGNP